MSEPLDADLLREARAGNEAAFTQLYVRHRPAALRLARSYCRRADPEDLVSAAFEKVLAALRRGNGPTESFRAYLFVTLRRVALGDLRRPRHESLDIVPEAVVAVSGLPPLDAGERRILNQAFEALPDRWQAVLWLTVVEGRHPREVARAVGMRANTVSPLAHRARGRLCETYLQAHLRVRPAPTCDPHRSRLGGYVRGGLSRRHRTAVVEHLETCASCRELVVELNDVNRRLVRSVLPLFAPGTGLAPYLTGAASLPGTTGAGGALAGLEAAAVPAPATGMSAAVGAGAGASATKAAMAAAAAVVLAVSLVPGLGRSGDLPPALAADAPPGLGDGATTPPPRRTSGEAEAGPRAPGRADGGDSTGSDDAAMAPTGTTVATNGSGELVDAGVAVGLGPVLEVAAGAEVGPGVELNASWTSSLLGAGTLAIDVANPGGGAVSGLTVDVQLSPQARATTLLSSGCTASDPGLVGQALSLVDALTCSVGSLPAGAGVALYIPLQVSGPGQTATVVLRGPSSEVLDTAVVELPA